MVLYDSKKRTSESKEGSSKKKKKKREVASDDETRKQNAAWGKAQLDSNGVWGHTVSLDVRKFQAPQPPANIRRPDLRRITQLASNFSEGQLTPAKLLLVDVHPKTGRLLTSLKWGREQDDEEGFKKLFNQKSVKEISKAYGEPWVIGGYHSSQAQQRKHEEDNNVSVKRHTVVFRASQLLRPGETLEQIGYMGVLSNARHLATADNTLRQNNENYDSQPLLTLVQLWNDLWKVMGSPVASIKGKHSDAYNAFKENAIAGVERLASLKNDNTLSPIFKFCTLPDNLLEKAITLICSMDMTVEANQRLPYVQCSPDKKLSAKLGPATLEDIRAVSRYPLDDLHHFIKIAHDDEYVVEVARELPGRVTPPKALGESGGPCWTTVVRLTVMTIMCMTK